MCMRVTHDVCTHILLLQELRKTSKPMAHKPFVSAASHSSRAFTPDPQLYHKEAPQQQQQQTTNSDAASRSGSMQRSSSATREQRPHAPVWRPASGRKLGAAASSFGLPEYVPDPVREAKVSRQLSLHQQQQVAADAPYVQRLCFENDEPSSTVHVCHPSPDLTSPLLPCCFVSAVPCQQGRRSQALQAGQWAAGAAVHVVAQPLCSRRAPRTQHQLHHHLMRLWVCGVDVVCVACASLQRAPARPRSASAAWLSSSSRCPLLVWLWDHPQRDVLRALCAGSQGCVEGCGVQS
jgi:hypothetical protein